MCDMCDILMIFLKILHHNFYMVYVIHEILVSGQHI